MVQIKISTIRMVSWSINSTLVNSFTETLTPKVTGLLHGMEKQMRPSEKRLLSSLKLTLIKLTLNHGPVILMMISTQLKMIATLSVHLNAWAWSPMSWTSEWLTLAMPEDATATTLRWALTSALLNARNHASLLEVAKANSIDAFKNLANAHQELIEL